jgi:putative DNA primase/helicase
MINDRQIIISAAGSRKATQWPPQKLWWSELVTKLQTPVRGTETLAEYLSFPKSRQDDLKDVGGFVAGTLLHNRRKAANVTGRDVITLDLDNIPAGGTQDILRRVDGLGCSYCIYSTRKHEEARPRLRILLPTDRTVTADEYEPLARKLAELIGIEFCDPTTFEVHRLMFWPSCCSDSQYVYLYGDKPFLSADGVLNLYQDWRNVNEWPEVPGTQQTQKKLAAKQGDPTEKQGIVGAFCRTYDIHTAIATFIPDAYTPCDIPDRYTYTGGSTVAGAVVYDHGQFLFSHHATDPCSGKLVNSFDLVRLHKFHELDDDAKPDTPTNRLPSFTAMCEFAVQDTHVAALLNQERYEKATEDFQQPTEDNLNWMKLLAYNTAGVPLKTIDNVIIILEHDPLLKNKMAFDEFANRVLALGELPWDNRKEKRIWGDPDDAGFMHYLEKVYCIQISENRLQAAMTVCAHKNKINDVKRYLTSLQWDGIPRLDTLLIDYLGAEDNVYTRAVMRKSLTAAVARAMTPGVKYDYMPILVGPQNIGKSTFLQILGKDWFSDSLQTFDGKEAAEMIQSTWINELGELGGFSKAETNIIKQFLSRTDDIFREPFGRRTNKYPRRCVFFGTTNDKEFLKDRTGNRRFWPVEVWINAPTKNVFTDLKEELDQVWAESFVRWQAGEPLYLTGEVKTIAEQEQKAHMESNTKEGFIQEFLNKPLPVNWDNRDLPERGMYWSGMSNPQGEHRARTKVCAAEIWCECFNKDISFMKKSDAAEINSILDSVPGWVKDKTPRKFGPYGSQRGYSRLQPPDSEIVVPQKVVAFEGLQNYNVTTSNAVGRNPLK